MNRRGVWVVMVMSALMVLVCVPKAWGQRPPETHPVSTTQDIVMTWDRSAMPGGIELWAPRTLLGYDDANAAREYGALHLVCQSESNSEKGLCPTLGQNIDLVGIHQIRLSFTERRSNLRTEISLDGAVQRAMSGRACLGDFWQNALYAPWSSYGVRCASDLPAGTGGQLRLSGEEVAKLVAGHWQATLELGLMTPRNGNVATYIFNFDFTITDHNAASIYFPQFESTTPLVNLDARYDPIQQTVGGRTVVEMCLYDGLGSQASYLAVTARDISPRSAGNSGFSLWHDSSGSDPSQRLDYTVTLDHNGARVPLSNGVEEQLTGIDSSQLRLVMLPGMSQPVFCVNTPMTLDMPRVPSTSKRSGIYWGDLQLELRVPAGTP
ncbi:CfaE/CblD family pilus tip adhesin [uncultured Stenotrophomonas sp.]|uniref:CfaE/CblD family pilus tip adhesin n=1 Tax=uncultured Stenotrophomonas sp. TaxID=165438 RepID=UPI0025FFFDE3|nr:CfaE/CblD family pilus tip adhesin [uncultured Stenotrophomonas sp.]